jgi:spore coat polysaccharide biosynthesis protein SpsF
VIKIPSDCPLIDPVIIDKVILYYISNKENFDFISNLHPPSYPDGNDVEIMSFKTLENTWINAKKDFEREHTTPYIWENPDKFRIGNVVWESGLDYSMTHRFTLTIKKIDFIKVFTMTIRNNNQFGLEDILSPPESLRLPNECMEQSRMPRIETILEQIKKTKCHLLTDNKNCG